MSKFIVTVKRCICEEYQVEAESGEDAETLGIMAAMSDDDKPINSYGLEISVTETEEIDAKPICG